MVGKDGVFDDPAGGGALGAVAEELAVGGDEERAFGFEDCDVDFVFLFLGPGGRWLRGCCCCRDGGDLGADFFQQDRVRVYGQEHPEECRCGVDEDAYQIAYFEAGHVVSRATVVDYGVVAYSQHAETVLVVTAVEVLVDSLVELSAASEAFSSRILGIKSEDYHGEVLLEVPDSSLSFRRLGSLRLLNRANLPKSLRQLRLKPDGIFLPINRLGTRNRKSRPDPLKKSPLPTPLNGPLIKEWCQSPQHSFIHPIEIRTRSHFPVHTLMRLVRNAYLSFFTYNLTVNVILDQTHSPRVGRQIKDSGS